MKKKDGFCQVVYLKCKRLNKKKREKNRFGQVVDLKFTRNTKRKKKKSWGLDQVVYQDNKKFTIRTQEKKYGFNCIVDLKSSKK